MAEKMYEVLSDKFTGKNRVYIKGNIIPRSEIFKNCDLKVCLKGQIDVRRGSKRLPNKKPSLKLVGQKNKKGE